MGFSQNLSSHDHIKIAPKLKNNLQWYFNIPSCPDLLAASFISTHVSMITPAKENSKENP